MKLRKIQNCLGVVYKGGGVRTGEGGWQNYKLDTLETAGAKKNGKTIMNELEFNISPRFEIGNRVQLE